MNNPQNVQKNARYNNYGMNFANLLKIVLCILIILLLIFLFKDLLMPKQELPSMNLTDQSPLYLSTVAPK